jgi:hypothetical protein
MVQSSGESSLPTGVCQVLRTGPHDRINPRFGHRATIPGRHRITGKAAKRRFRPQSGAMVLAKAGPDAFGEPDKDPAMPSQAADRNRSRNLLILALNNCVIRHR